MQGKRRTDSVKIEPVFIFYCSFKIKKYVLTKIDYCDIFALET